MVLDEEVVGLGVLILEEVGGVGLWGLLGYEGGEGIVGRWGLQWSSSSFPIVIINIVVINHCH